MLQEDQTNNLSIKNNLELRQNLREDELYFLKKAYTVSKTMNQKINYN